MKIHAIQTGTVEIKTNQRLGKGHGFMRQVNMLLDSSWTEPLPIYAWAVEHPEGVIVVDTGDTARTKEPGYFPWWHPYFRFGVKLNVEPEQEIGPQLRELGVHPSDVRKVILTHFHTDHAGGIYHFPRSEFLVSGEDYRFAQGLAGRRRGYLPHRWPDWFAPKSIPFEAQAFGPFERSYAVTETGDVVVVPTPGHTPAHVSVIVVTDGLDYFLSGDTSYSEQILLDQKVDGVSPDEGIALQTIQKILRCAQERPMVYLPSHDPHSQHRLEKRITLRSDRFATEAQAAL